MLRAVLAFSRFEFELFFKTFIAVFFTFLAPCGIFGAAVASQKGDKLAAASSYLPVLLALIIVFVSLYTLAAQVVSYREMGFYKRILITRINSVGIALSNAIRGYVLVLIGFFLLSVQTRLMFGAFPSLDPVGAIVAIFFAGGALFLVGLVFACFVKNGTAMFTLASVFSYVLVFFSGAFPKTDKYTSWAAVVDQVSPSYHALRVLRAGFGGTLFQADMLWSVAFLVITMGLCLLVIRRYLSWM